MHKKKRPGGAWGRFINDSPRSIRLQRGILDSTARLLGKTPASARCKKTNLGGVSAETINGWAHDDGRTLLYLHGGGYMMGSLETHRPLASILSRISKSRGVIIAYRLAPKHPFPAALEDARAAYGALLESGLPAGKIALAGDSAGGGLSLALLLSLRDAGLPLPAGAYLMSPWADLSPRRKHRPGRPRPMVPVGLYIEFMARLYAGGHDRFDPLLSPVFGDYTGVCPLLIQTAKGERIRNHSLRVAQKARTQGVDVTLNLYEGDVHVLQGFAGVSPLGRMLVRQGGLFLRRHLES